LEFRFQFISQLASQEDICYKHNISNLQAKAIRFFLKHTPFVVLECDKKTGALIMSKEKEIELALNSLQDVNTYIELDSDPLEATCVELRSLITELISSNDVSYKLGELLINDKAKLGKFRILPKIHKPNSFGIRPIINCINSPTNKISKLLFLIIQPLVVNSSSYLQDSQHLLQIINELN
jgi:hypothetical protein